MSELTSSNGAQLEEDLPDFTEMVVRQLNVLTEAVKLLYGKGVFPGLDDLPERMTDRRLIAVIKWTMARAGEVATSVAAQTTIQVASSFRGQPPPPRSKRVEHDVQGRIVRIIDEDI